MDRRDFLATVGAVAGASLLPACTPEAPPATPPGRIFGNSVELGHRLVDVADAVALFGGNLPPGLRARVLSVQAWIAIGFLLFILLTSNPFNRLAPAPVPEAPSSVPRRTASWLRSGMWYRSCRRALT